MGSITGRQLEGWDVVQRMSQKRSGPRTGPMHDAVSSLVHGRGDRKSEFGEGGEEEEERDKQSKLAVGDGDRWGRNWYLKQMVD